MTRSNLAVGLDVGCRIRCVICLVENSRLRFLGYGEAPAQGWDRSCIEDHQAISEAIRKAVSEAEGLAQTSVEAAVIGMGGKAVQSVNHCGLYDMGRPRMLEPGDLDYAVRRAMKLRLEDHQTLLQVCPQDFVVDGRPGFRKPLNIRCSRLEANVRVITAAIQDYEFLISAVHQAHLAVDECIFEGVAAAYASILPNERERGVAVVDIGAQSTEIAVYDGEALVAAAGIGVGGDHFTRDLAYCLTTSYEDAEMLKVDYGCALLGLTGDNNLVEIPSPDGRPPREATRRQVNEILEARGEELFELVRDEITQAGMDRALMEGVVLCGGGAKLPGLCDLAERILNCQARNGLAIGIRDWPEEINNTEWTTAAGLSMYSARLTLRRERRRRAPGIKGMLVR